MLRLLLCLALVALASCTTGCATSNIKDALSNLDKDCTRHYAGSLGGSVVSSAIVTFQIDCKPNSEVGKPDPAPPAPAPAAKPPGG